MYHQQAKYESRWEFCPFFVANSQVFTCYRARVTTFLSIRYIIDAAKAFKLSWKYRPAVRVINVPPAYKVLNFRSVKRRNISRNMATTTQRDAAIYQPDENYSVDEDVNIELESMVALAFAVHIVLTKRYRFTINFIMECGKFDDGCY